MSVPKQSSTAVFAFLLGAGASLLLTAVWHHTRENADAAVDPTAQTVTLMGQLGERSGTAFDDAAIGDMIAIGAEEDNLAHLALSRGQDSQLRDVSRQIVESRRHETTLLEHLSQQKSVTPATQ